MRWVRAIPALALGTALWVTGGDASACGGTFCDGGPLAMPVDQKGENILFVVDGGKVEAHIQIQYEGDPAKFAWVLPVPAVPEAIEVGSQVLFGNLLAATVPMYGMSFCAVLINGGGGNYEQSPSPGPVEVLLRDTVGAFDVTVVSGQTSADIVQWLSDNGYEQIPEAPALFDDYVANGFVFVAVKLTGGAGVDEIHPLLVRYADQGEGACVPLKLTAVAALPDMGVRTFFLGNGRVVPWNYAHVEPNPAQFDWINFADNYNEVIARAVDEAGGHAFVTEYAGPSNIVSNAGLYDPRWDPNPFVSAQPEEVVDGLIAQGLAQCGGGTCQFNHTQLLPLLRQYLPAPAGVNELGFYSCLACYRMDIDRAAWDGVAFARDFLERIVTPGLHATELLARYPYLTRLFTEISPEEMTEDPLFIERADLEPVAALRTASGCGGSWDVTFNEGFGVNLSADGSWPSFGEEMPWALTVTQYSDTGEEALVADNTAMITAVLDEWNAMQSGTTDPVGSFPPGDLSGPTPPPGSDPVMPGTNPPESTTTDQPTIEGGGCGCRGAHGPISRSGFAWAAAGILAYRLRRRARSR